LDAFTVLPPPFLHGHTPARELPQYQAAKKTDPADLLPAPSNGNEFHFALNRSVQKAGDMPRN